ncbi:hypothetical protein F4780DRAFT_250361 [Xylariomycetidae sp. FL0641]|nr:hypothetical protein F4780DRAFT_250361 [Xylariomycetidae sp. FL0641]
MMMRRCLEGLEIISRGGARGVLGLGACLLACLLPVCLLTCCLGSSGRWARCLWALLCPGAAPALSSLSSLSLSLSRSLVPPRDRARMDPGWQESKVSSVAKKWLGKHRCEYTYLIQVPAIRIGRTMLRVDWKKADARPWPVALPVQSPAQIPMSPTRGRSVSLVLCTAAQFLRASFRGQCTWLGSLVQGPN